MKFGNNMKIKNPYTLNIDNIRRFLYFYVPDTDYVTYDKLKHKFEQLFNVHISLIREAECNLKNNITDLLNEWEKINRSKILKNIKLQRWKEIVDRNADIIFVMLNWSSRRNIRSNPLSVTPDNVRRWMYLNAHKFETINKWGHHLIRNNDFNDAGRRYFNLPMDQRINWYNGLIFTANEIYTAIFSSNLTKFEKKQFWKYYMSSLDRMKLITDIFNNENITIYNTNLSTQTLIKWMQLLKQYYEKE